MASSKNVDSDLNYYRKKIEKNGVFHFLKGFALL